MGLWGQEAAAAEGTARERFGPVKFGEKLRFDVLENPCDPAARPKLDAFLATHYSPDMQAMQGWVLDLAWPRSRCL